MAAVNKDVEKLCGRPLSSIIFVKSFCRCGCENCECVPTFQNTLPCGCKFCDICYKHQDVRWPLVECSFHKKRFRTTTVKTVQIGMEDVKNMQVYCKNKINGCTHASTIKNLKHHEDLDCCYKHVYCPMNCGNEILLKDCVDHWNFSCPKKIEECCYCRTFIMQYRRENHFQECEKFPVDCPFCKNKLERCELKAHQDKCEERPVPCSFSEIGCTYSGKRSMVAEHEAIEKHMDLLLENFRQLNQMKMEAEYQRDEARTEVEGLKCIFERMEEKKNASVEDLLQDFKSAMKELKQVRDVAVNMFSLLYEKWPEEMTPEGVSKVITMMPLRRPFNSPTCNPMGTQTDESEGQISDETVKGE